MLLALALPFLVTAVEPLPLNFDAQKTLTLREVVEHQCVDTAANGRDLALLSKDARIETGLALIDGKAVDPRVTVTLHGIEAKDLVTNPRAAVLAGLAARFSNCLATLGVVPFGRGDDAWTAEVFNRHFALRIALKPKPIVPADVQYFALKDGGFVSVAAPGR